MTSAQNDSLAKAVQYLGAVEVAPFTFAWQNADGWWTLDHKYVRILFDYVHGHTPLEPLSKKQLGLTKMPSWWSPSQRFALVIYDEDGYRDVTPAKSVEWARYEYRAVLGDLSWKVITADLATGEEVPA